MKTILKILDKLFYFIMSRVFHIDDVDGFVTNALDGINGLIKIMEKYNEG